MRAESRRSAALVGSSAKRVGARRPWPGRYWGRKCFSHRRNPAERTETGANGDPVVAFRAGAGRSPIAAGVRDEDRGDEVTAGIVGLGYWGPNILRVLAEQANVNVRWICDRDPERLERMARRYPASIPTQRYEDLLEDPELDAILIVTPVGTHAGLAEASLEAGKHTFVEKPLAASAVEAERLAGTRPRRRAWC